MCFEGDTEPALLAGGHVDDFLISVRRNCKRSDAALQQLREAVPWGEFVEDHFVQCGVEIAVDPVTNNIFMHQEHFSLGMEEAVIPRARMLDPKSPLIETEQTQMKSILGSGQWLVQTRADVAAEVSYLQSCVTTGTIEDLIKANKLVQMCKSASEIGMEMKSIPIKDLCLLMFSDASWGSRRNGGSQGGHLLLGVNRAVLGGAASEYSVLDFASKKLRRTVRSSLAAETQALSVSFDMLELARFTLAEMLSAKSIDVRNPDDTIRKVCGAAVIDCKSLWDGLCRSESAGLGLADVRSGIETIELRERSHAQEIRVKWVDTFQQYADGLTKCSARESLIRKLNQEQIRLTFDPNFTAGKKKRKAVCSYDSPLHSKLKAPVSQHAAQR